MLGVVQRVVAGLGFSRLLDGVAAGSADAAVSAHPATTVPGTATGSASAVAAAGASQTHQVAGAGSSGSVVMAWAALVGVSAEALVGPSAATATARRVHASSAPATGVASVVAAVTALRSVVASAGGAVTAAAGVVLVCDTNGYGQFVSSLVAAPSRILRLRVPTLTDVAGTSRLLRRYTAPVAQTLIVRDGGFALYVGVDDDLVAGADAVYPGGRKWQLTEAEYALLDAAGASEFVEVA